MKRSVIEKQSSKLHCFTSLVRNAVISYCLYNLCLSASFISTVYCLCRNLCWFIFVTVQKKYSAKKMVAFGGSYGGK